jgi:hypothetical protein
MSKPNWKVIRKVEKLLSTHDVATVMEILDQYGVKSYETGRTRVQLAILKVFQGGARENESPEEALDRLRRLVTAAKSDYRDVLAWAEYPAEIKKGFVGMKELTKTEASELRKRDREQYEQWLKEE